MEQRLIDANALKKAFSNMYREDYERWIKEVIDNAPTIRDKSMREFFMSEQLRPRRYRVKFRNYQVLRYIEKRRRVAYARGYSEGLEKGMEFYNETAAKIRELISEGGGSHDSSRND